jgi:hypothetical protein
MPLINCPDCNKEVSPAAPNCMYCGRPIANAVQFQPITDKKGLTSDLLKLFGGVAMIFLVLYIWGSIRQSNDTESKSTTVQQSFASTNTSSSYTIPRNTPNPFADTTETGIRSNIAEIKKEITYEHLKKNADKYRFDAWAFKGKILQIFEEGGKTGARISLDDWGNKVMWVTCDCTTDFVEDDRVFVVGYLSGTHSYTSQANWELEIPSMIARVILSSKEAAKYQNNGKKK